MDCPKCGAVYRKNTVLATRVDTIESIIRNRKCLDCNHRWYTLEIEIPFAGLKYVTGAIGADGRRHYWSIKRLPGFRRIKFF